MACRWCDRRVSSASCYCLPCDSLSVRSWLRLAVLYTSWISMAFPVVGNISIQRKKLPNSGTLWPPPLVFQRTLDSEFQGLHSSEPADCTALRLWSVRASRVESEATHLKEARKQRKSERASERASVRNKMPSLKGILHRELLPPTPSHSLSLFI